MSQCESPGRVGPSNDRVFGDARTRGRSRGRGSGSGAARPQVLEAVSHDRRAQYDLLEPGEEDCDHPRVACGVDASVSGDARPLPGMVTPAERGPPLLAALWAHRGGE